MFVLLAALLGGCGSSSNSTAESTGAAPPATVQRLTGDWEGPGIAVSLNETDGLVTGHGRLQQGSVVTPFELSGRLEANGDVHVTHLPSGGGHQAGHGHLAAGALDLALGTDKSVQLQPAARPTPPSFLVIASDYRFILNLGQSLWECAPPLVDNNHLGTLNWLRGPDHTLVVTLTAGGLRCGQLTFPAGGGQLVASSYVINQAGQRVTLSGTASAGPPATSGALPPGPAATPVTVPGEWTGPDFDIMVTQSGSYLSASGTYKSLL